MEIFRDIDSLPVFSNAVITIGTFDGVHLGHQQILRQLTGEAQSINGTSVLITFYPHPKQIVGFDKKTLYTLNTVEEKATLLEQAGIEKLVIVPFNKAFSDQTADEYIGNFLVKNFHPHTIIIGYDHRFGKNRSGDYQMLEKYAEKYHYTVKEIPEHILRDVTISSTAIRKALLSGDIATANTLLGYDYFFSGKVVEGNQLGRQINFPTANIETEDANKLIPANGVYAVRLKIADDEPAYKGMMNIGMRPTVGGDKHTIEVNVFDFNRDIYQKNITVSVVEKIRDEIRFDNIEALKVQLSKDSIEAKKLLL